MLTKDELISIGYTFEIDGDEPPQWIWRNAQTVSDVKFLNEGFAVQVAAKLAESLELHRCDNCGKLHTEVMLKPIADLEQRIAPGEIVPSGECAACGCLCHQINGKDSAPSPWDPFQQIVVDSYNGGDHLAEHPDNKFDVGDTLLSFLLSELSESEDCNSIEEAIRRIDSAIDELQQLRNAFEEKQSA